MALKDKRLMKKRLVFSTSPASQDANSWLQKNAVVYLAPNVTVRRCHFYKVLKEMRRSQSCACNLIAAAVVLRRFGDSSFYLNRSIISV